MALLGFWAYACFNAGMNTPTAKLHGKGLPKQSRRRLRLPLLLLGALLFNVLAISSLTMHALRGQRAELEDTLQASREGSLALLANQVEQSLQNMVQRPFLLLKNLRQEDITPPLIKSLRVSFPNVEEVMILDQDLKLARAFPGLRSHRQQITTTWIVERVRQERLSVEHAPFALHTFVENLNGQATLFAFQALSEQPSAAAPESWVLLRFRLDHAISDQIAPLLSTFEDTNGSAVLLLSPDDAVPKGQIQVDLNDILPGWQLATSRVPATLGRNAAHSQDLAIISVAGGAVLAVALTITAGWWEIRREHALLDLRNRFIASVSHELKTPLSLIRMYAETLCLHRQPDPQKQDEYLQIMLRESERLSLMINDVLSYTRIRDGNMVYHLTHPDLAATISEVADQYAAHFAARGLKLELHIPQQVPTVYHDPNGITQVLLNLLDNAAKYAASGGGAVISLEVGSRQLELAVTDYGPGITAPLREQLGQAFQKSEMVEGARGSGLGLALVAHIAADHGAQFKLTTPTGHEGARAVMSFPIGGFKV